MGRPKDLTPEMKGQVIAFVRAGYGKGGAASEVGVSRETVRKEEKLDPEFARQLAEGKADAVDAMAKAMFDKGRSGNVQAAKVWLQIMEMDDDIPDGTDDEDEEKRKAALEAQLPPMNQTES